MAAELGNDCGQDGYGSLTATLDVSGDNADTLALIPGGDAASDWYLVDLDAGDTLLVSADSTTEDEDALVRVYDDEGTLIGSGYATELQVEVDDGGTYFIEVSSHAEMTEDSLQIGSLAADGVPTPLDAIRGNTQLNDDDTVLVYFAEAGDTYRQLFFTYTADGTTAYEQAQYFSVFEGIEEFADIDFEITTDREAADLEIATGNIPGGGSGTILGLFNFPNSNGDGKWGILNNTFEGYSDAPGGSLDTGGFMYGVALHEFGHGLGLGHPHDTGNGSDVMLGVDNSDDMGAFDLNQPAFTSMTYVEGSPQTGAAAVDASNGHQATYGALDIAVLQEFYGVNTTHAAGDDVYLLHDNNDPGSAAAFYTTWDTGGTDEIRYVGTKDATIELRAATLQYEEGGGGFLSWVDGVFAGRTIANGVVIENASSDAGNDTLVGNDVANDLNSGAGADRLFGLAGNDTLTAGADDDRAVGGDDDDLLVGNAGMDTLKGNDGNDDLQGRKDNDTLLGGKGDDILDGGNNDDALLGGRGNDTLDGGNGNDTLQGAGGNDTFVFSAGQDVINDYGGDNERIDLSAAVGINSYKDLFSGRIEQINNDAVITDDAGSVLTILNTDVGSLDAFEFIF